MKKLSKPLLMLLLCLTTAASFSQTTVKPKQFTLFPDRIDIESIILQKTFASNQGQQVSVTFGSLIFNGVVLSNDIKYSNLQTITIRSTEFSNTLLSISKITNPDNSFTYTGRTINNSFFDGYEIKKSDAGNYKLQKFESDRILQDCSY